MTKKRTHINATGVAGTAGTFARRLVRSATISLFAILVFAHPAAAAPPANDDFDQATTISSLPFVHELDATEATGAPDDPTQCGTGAAPRATVWYRHTPAMASTIGANTAGTTYSNALSVWTGSRGSLTLVACSISPSRGVTFAASPNTTYHFMVDSLGGQEPGRLVFTIPRKTELALGLSRSTVPYGGRVTLTARLDPAAAAANPVVSVYSLVGTRRTLVKAEAVDANGELRLTLKASRTTRFLAEWDGGQGWLPAESPQVLLKVPVIVQARLSGHYGRAGAYHLYRAGTYVKQTCTVKPSHRGKKLVFVAQRNAGGTWKRFATGRFKLRANSSVSAYLGAPPGRYRLRCYLPAHSDHERGNSPWGYAAIR